ncbi:hypothetical protein BN997_01139 [Oceanobacillus oncorhynchi]|uniref:Uncharacterized protein n=1 Tax=Oceanobacillus oncorhynchi TaxID=545501 RepID=A0A0A1MQN5_9BACI|nr:hypothetical protein [Oceanobacillus oncorhynchi]CEI81321.1 hypothetical protein BN997_01139 [Oceanobacillus oncorhynchi]
MEKIIKGHICGFGTVRDMERIENDFDEGITIVVAVRKHRKYEKTPSKEECDRICEDRSGEVVIIQLPQA